MVGMLAQSGCNTDQGCLNEIRQEEPKASFAAENISQLATDQATSGKKSETGAHIRQADETTAEAESSDGKEGSISCLIGGKDVVLGKGHHVHDAGREG